jgi:hypothetical protein
MDHARAAAMRDTRIVDRLIQSTLDDMIDFRDLSDFERRVIRRAVPFYSWMKGISKRAVKLYLEQPVLASAIAAMSEYGLAENADGPLKGTPSFIRGALDAGKGSDAGHRKILTTVGWNPFQTVADVAGIGSSLAGGKMRFGGENALSQLNPLFRAPIEAYANRDLFYGKPIHYDDADRNFLVDSVGRTIGGLPQKALYDKWRMAGTDKAATAMYTPTHGNTIKNYLGYPVRDVNLAVARLRGREEKAGATELS